MKTLKLRTTKPKKLFFLYCTILLQIIISNQITAEQFIVTNNNSDGTGSFYQAIIDADINPGFDTILFDVSVRGTIKTDYGLPAITESLIIFGPGADLLSIDPEFNGRGLMTDEFSADSLFVYGLTFTNGNAKAGAGAGIFLDGGKSCFYDCKIIGNENTPTSIGGGGVYIFGGYTYFFNCEISNNSCYLGGAGITVTSSSKVFIYNCGINNNSVVESSSSKGGGAIYNAGDIYIENTTISGNSHPDFGGGIYNLLFDRNIRLNHVTITNNSAEVGGGIYNKDESGTDTIFFKNTIIAGNTASDEGNDLWGEFISEGYNLIQDITNATISGLTDNNIYNVDPQLGTLGYHAYNTQFHPLLSNSPAIDKASEEESLQNDQCGTKRPYDGDNDGSNIADIGAVEYILDSDLDGICDIEEQGEDGTETDYDGNDDGVPDKNQSNVTSLKTYDESYYITIAAPENTCLSRVIATQVPIQQSKKAASDDFPLGFFSFKVDSLHKASSSDVELYLPSGSTIENYYNYGPTLSNIFLHLYEFNDDGETGADINNNKVTLQFIDGQIGDHDLTANNCLLSYGGPKVEAGTSSVFSPNYKSLLSFPNPFITIIKFQLPVGISKRAVVKIFNMEGKVIKKETIHINRSNPIEIDGSDLAYGTYIYKITCGGNVYSGKIIKSISIF